MYLTLILGRQTHRFENFIQQFCDFVTKIVYETCNVFIIYLADILGPVLNERLKFRNLQKLGKSVGKEVNSMVENWLQIDVQYVWTKVLQYYRQINTCKIGKVCI